MSHPVDEHVGKKLKNLRVLRGLTQTDVAKGLDISFQQVQKYELGRNRISASKLFEISRILDVPPSYFFDGLNEVEETGGPVLDEETARIASVISKITDERLKTQIRASEIYAKDSTQGLARRYGQALAMGFSVEDVQAWTETLMAVTPEDVMAAADMIFDRNKAVTGFLTRPEPPASETPAEVTQ